MIRRLSELTDDEIEALCAEAARKGLGLWDVWSSGCRVQGLATRVEDLGV